MEKGALDIIEPQPYKQTRKFNKEQFHLLKKLQGYLHELMIKYSGGLVKKNNYQLPVLSPDRMEEYLKGKYDAIPGMYGGFKWRIEEQPQAVDPDERMVIKCDSRVRICEGSEKGYLVTGKGYKLTYGGLE